MRPTVEINQADIARLKSDLRLMDREVPVVISRVINRALSAVNTEASIQVRKHYNLKAARVKQNFKMRKSTPSSLGGVWVSSGRPVGLRQFGARQNRAGVSVQVMTGKKRKTVDGAFIQIPRSPRVERTGPQVYWRAKEGGVRVWRYPIKRLSGPRVEDALSKPGVQKALQDKADIVIIDRLKREADYILSKAR